MEAGPAWATRNDVKIPPATGTRFSLLDLTDEGPESYFRAYASFNINRKHGIRVLAAPLEIRGSRPLDRPVSFAGETFAAATNTDGILKVNCGLGKGVTLRAGCRALEGGADVESVYTFAWLHYAAASLGYRF